MNPPFLFDVHLDLALNAIEWNRDLRRPLGELRRSEAHLNDKPGRGRGTVTLPEMRRARAGLCVATQLARLEHDAYSPIFGWRSAPQAWAMTQAQLAWYRCMEEAGEMVQIRDLAGLDAHLAAWLHADEATAERLPVGYVLSLEGADSLVTLQHLERAYDYGLRAIGPAHYGPGVYAQGTDSTGGFPAIGLDLLREIDRLGLILDVTHLSDECFWQALDVFSGPVWASHHNARALAPHQRQLSDDMFRALVERGAVVGLALDAWMMIPGWERGKTTPQSSGLRLEKIVEHLDHFCQIAGNARHVGLGTDLDGCFGTEQTPQDLDSIAGLQQLPALLTARGYTDADVTGIMHGNFLGHLRRAWGALSPSILLTCLWLAFLTGGSAGAAPRPEWHNTRLRGSPDKPSEMVAVRAYPGVPIKRPVVIEREPGTSRLLVLENLAWDVYKSTLKAFADDPASAAAETLLDIPGNGEVAYSLCFHPRYAENGYLYIGSNGVGPGEKHHSRIVRYTVARQAPHGIDPTTAVTIIEWPSNGHNGAAATFGSDGMLYVTSGDGTPNSDSNLAGQDTASMLSKVLRLDVDGAPEGQTYRVPADNPFIGNSEVRPETWAYGMRNPWRITHDPDSGQIWVGQNGQDLREYAHLLERGANYGWSEFEGSRAFQPGRLRGPSAFTPPTLEHDHAVFRSLTGGFVYRGKKFPSLQGAYIYGDYGTGRVWAARHDGKTLLWHREIADTPTAIAGFGTNEAGDILIADHLGDAIMRLELAPPPAADRPPFPERLSETGLFASVADQQPAPGVLPYAINAPAWHDGATGERWLALHGNGVAEMPNAGDSTWVWKSWNLPDGTALVQTLALSASEGTPARRVETRVLLKQEADWAAYSYVWNDAQTDATLAPAQGARLPLPGREWVVPARSECVLCHARGANYALGLTAAQLNREVTVDGTSLNQLSHWDGLDVLREAGQSREAGSPLRKLPSELPRLVNPHDAAAPIAERARAYFATNCSHCHRYEGGGNSRMDLSPWMNGEAQHLVDAAPQHGTYSMPEARLIAPGEPGRSVLPVRVSSRGPGQMPPVGTTVLDPQGLSLIFEWLVSLKPPPATSR